MTGLVDGNNFFVSCERIFDRSLLGRPVAVLSNNDGCCVARSNEFKALGIPMGTPYFKLKDRERSGELVFKSSNYELYGEISNRIISILRDDALDVEQYSIDEAFITPPMENRNVLEAYGRNLRAKILRWVGIPCGIGFAPTKTLAKIANHIAKKRESGVFVFPDEYDSLLASLPVGEVWGVGRRLPSKLHARGIVTALALRDAPDSTLLSVGGITLLRTATELRGIACHEDRAYDVDPESVSCSRSFGEPATTLEALSEALSNFAAQAAEKLRRHSLLASGCNIYAQLFASGGGGEFLGRTVVFPKITDATNEMLTAISPFVEKLFIKDQRYRKAGIVFFGLEKAGVPRQDDLFAPQGSLQQSTLYKVVDKLNSRYGKNTVFSAAEGIGKRSWRLKREKLSPRATTRWNELLQVH